MTQEIFDLAEVQSIGCLCSKCGSEMILVIATAQFRSDQCPNCGASWYPIDDILKGFLDIHKLIVNSKLKIRLRTIPMGSEKPSV
jgi:Zn-finger nucleic acid-binding protein